MTSTLAPSLARKAKKILDTRTEAPEVLGALNSLSSFYEDNTPTARRQLHTTVVCRGLSVNNEFLSGANQLFEAMEKAQQDLDALAACCAEGSSALAATWANTAELLHAMDQIQKDLATSHTRSRLIADFLHQYELTPAQSHALQDSEIGPAFFEALERVRHIHADCRRLLRTHYQRAGLELMDAMAAHQEAAYERLCRWLQAEWRNLGDMDAPEVDPLLQRASQALRARPALFHHCAHEVASARHSALFQRFIAALTRGGPGGMPRPMEVHAHDPLRYLGDMLAWVHQSLASERDLFVALFGSDGASPADAASSRGAGRPSDTPEIEAEDGEGLPDTAALLDRVFESICRPLKVRIEQVLLSSPPLVTTFKVTQLLGFYAATLGPLVGRTAQLSVTLLACRALAARTFTEQLKGRGDKLSRRPPQPPQDLSVPPQVQDAVRQMADVIAAYESAADTSDMETARAEFEPVLSACLQPILTACQKSAEALALDAPSRVDEKAGIDPSARPVFLLNCTCALSDVLAHHACCASGAAQVAAQITSLLEELQAAAAAPLLSRSQLSSLAERIRLYQQHDKEGQQGTMSADPDLSPTHLATALRACFNLIMQPDALPEFRQLQVPRYRAAAAQGVAKALSSSYHVVYSVLASARSGEGADGSEVSEALKQTPEHVDTILGIT